MLVLAVETSCDETSVALVRNGKEVLSNIVLSQIDIHKVYGGVVPEIASRNHVVHITKVFDEAIKKANVSISDIDLVAVTKGPGLIGSLLVGINAATTFAFVNNLPIIGVNHLVGHIYAAQIDNELVFPALTLLVSGGHTELLYMKDHLDIKLLGTTFDDAVGEAYDKVARTLGLSYPGGPVIDKLAKEGNNVYNLPKPMINSDDLNFSFSGIKSAVINLKHNHDQKGLNIDVANMAASFQESVVEVLISKTKQALLQNETKTLILAGGVAANSYLRSEFVKNFDNDYNVIIPKLEYCTDNAAMIGAAAYYQYKKFEKSLDDYILEAQPNLSFDE